MVHLAWTESMSEGAHLTRSSFFLSFLPGAGVEPPASEAGGKGM